MFQEDNMFKYGHPYNVRPRFPQSNERYNYNHGGIQRGYQRHLPRYQNYFKPPFRNGNRRFTLDTRCRIGGNTRTGSQFRPSATNTAGANICHQFPRNQPMNVNTITSSELKITVNQNLGSFDSQAEDIISKISMTEARRREVDIVLSDLTNVWKKLIPDIQIAVFGSIAKGLAVQSSDIDCCMSSKTYPDPQELMKCMMKNLKAMHRSASFTKIIKIQHARVPVIKATHVKTAFEVDISTLSGNAVNVEPPILPPLQNILFQPTSSSWPCGLISQPKNYVNCSANKMGLSELFIGFFRFIRDFQFDCHVISPFLGVSFPLKLINNSDALPEELAALKTLYNDDSNKKKMFLDKDMKIQDPIEHFRNTSASIGNKHFQMFCRINQAFLSILESLSVSEWLTAMVNKDLICQKAKAASPDTSEVFKFDLSYPPKHNEALKDTWKEFLLDDFQSVFEFLLFKIDNDLNPPKAKQQKVDQSIELGKFNICTNYNVFAKKFKKNYVQVLKDPTVFVSAKQTNLEIRDRLKKPSSSFQADLLVFDSKDSPDKVHIEIRDINKNVQNTFNHMVLCLKTHLPQLINAAVMNRNGPIL